ncbi:MAG: hypothetical protein JSU63_06260 [Phycisphaerales bacterium]|nr:MAG: hypothetical protein JSU63_06260 [Phycisphaerales bacterium]
MPYAEGDPVRLKASIQLPAEIEPGHAAYRHGSGTGRTRYDIATEFDLQEEQLQEGDPPDGDPPNYTLQGGLPQQVVYSEADKGTVVSAQPPEYRVRLYYAILRDTAP